MHNQLTLIAPIPPWTGGYLHIMSKYEHDPWKIEAPDWTSEQKLFPWFACDKDNAPLSLNVTHEEWVSMEMLHYNHSHYVPFEDIMRELSYWTSISFYNNVHNAYIWNAYV